MAYSNVLEDLTGVWRGDTDGEIVALNLSGEAKSINVNGNLIPVSIKNIDNDNGIVSVNIDIEGQPVVWALRQVWDNNGEYFAVDIILHNGRQENLSFVRSL